ncbi:hypothetical protein FQA39_LY03970 [Lamprigera yunnana]|nr:hypothetical protein FQA39_LY03970 [Lamprigera yunnana]
MIVQTKRNVMEDEQELTTTAPDEAQVILPGPLNAINSPDEEGGSTNWTGSKAAPSNSSLLTPWDISCVPKIKRQHANRDRFRVYKKTIEVSMATKKSNTKWRKGKGKRNSIKFYGKKYAALEDVATSSVQHDVDIIIIPPDVDSQIDEEGFDEQSLDGEENIFPTDSAEVIDLQHINSSDEEGSTYEDNLPLSENPCSSPVKLDLPPKSINQHFFVPFVNNKARSAACCVLTDSKTDSYRTLKTVRQHRLKAAMLPSTT